MAPEERRQQLLTCALKVFSEHGLNAANHALVAEKAQVSVPTVFFYFPTREALVDAVLTEVERHYTHILVTAGKTEASPLGRLTTIIQSLTATLDTHAEFTRIYWEWSMTNHADNWARFLKLNRRFLQTYTRLIERGQQEGVFRPDLDPKDEAVITHASSTAIFQMNQSGVSPRRLDRFIRSIVHALEVQQPDGARGTQGAAQSSSIAAAAQVSATTPTAGIRIARSRQRSTVAKAARPTSRHKTTP